MEIDEAHIMVVDDEPLLIEIFRIWLERLGCTKIRTAFDGMDALAKLRQEPVDLLITDIRMPQMDGIALVRALRTENISLPGIVVISAFGDIDRREMYALGVKALLSKPIDMPEFANQVKNSLMPPEELWQTPFAQAPAQALVAEDVVLYDPDDVRSDAATLLIGRGGFAITRAGLMTLGKTSFDLSFRNGDQRLVGEGFVRWYSRTEMAAGVEMAYLAEPGRTWLLSQKLWARRNDYIPSP